MTKTCLREQWGTQYKDEHCTTQGEHCTLSGTLTCTQCPNVSNSSQQDSNYHFAKKHSAHDLMLFSSVNCVTTGFQEFALHVKIKNTQHGFPGKSVNANFDDIINEVDDPELGKELRSCQHFLVDSENAGERHKVFICAIKNLNAPILDE